MKKAILIVALLGYCFINTEAQQKGGVPSVRKFTSTLQLGILEGASSKSFGQLQLVSGIQQNAWFYGIGLGVDYYSSKRSIPLFFDLKKDFLTGNRRPYLYADAGYNVSWLRDKDKVSFWGTNYKQRGGIFYETGLGYKFLSKNKMAFGFSAGYSLKQQKEIVSPFMFAQFPIPQTENNPNPDVYEYTFRRISLKFNCWF